ncbi:MAG: hypothetical protein ABJL67_01910 [Sulfitobacter sp.]
MGYWRAFEAAKSCYDQLQASGIEVRVETNFSKVPDLVAEIGKSYLTPHLDPQRNDFTKQNCFWLSGRRGGNLVLLGGARIDDVGRDGADFLMSMINRGYGAGTIAGVSSKVDGILKGRCAYFGDLISKSAIGLGRKNVPLFSGIAHYLAASEFRADCTYSLMRSADVNLGSADRNGFTGRLLKPLDWGQKPQGRGEDELLVFRMRDDNDDYFSSFRRESVCKQLEPLEASMPAQLAIQA